jgi:sulfatase maturation enzyme AslB (radical SAM superfamily)
MKIVTTRIHRTLPVFRVDTETLCVVYTPGYMAVVDPAVAEAIWQAWERDKQPEEAAARQVANWLQTRARQAVDTWQQRIQSPFAPECLTIYLSNQCNSACSYCYVSPVRQRGGKTDLVVSEQSVRAAARLVARHCAEQGKSFYLVLHGGGEPTLHWELVERLESLTRQIAVQWDIEWFGYIATNGVVSEKKARWLANHSVASSSRRRRDFTR